MSSHTRDALVLYTIGALAVLVTLFGDLGLGRMFDLVLARL